MSGNQQLRDLVSEILAKIKAHPSYQKYKGEETEIIVPPYAGNEGEDN